MTYCRDCDRPMHQERHDRYVCRDCNQVFVHDGIHWRWERLPETVPAHLVGIEVSVMTANDGEWVGNVVNWRRKEA